MSSCFLKDWALMGVMGRLLLRVLFFLSVAYRELVESCLLIAVAKSFDRRFVQGLDDHCMKLALPSGEDILGHINTETADQTLSTRNNNSSLCIDFQDVNILSNNVR
jgi:hypothetical protein